MDVAGHHSAEEERSAENGQKHGYIAGLKTGQNEPRLEIDEFALDTDVLNLYLIALINIQERSETDRWSWFQIAGIHGRPFTSWDDVGPKPIAELGPNVTVSGYCSHSSVTFPTWHRPYLAMMEQTVYSEMIDLAKRYEDPETRENYLAACSRFRFPYWDPCIPRQPNDQLPVDSQTQPYYLGIPKLVSSEKVFLRFSDNPNRLVEANNPLHHYNFPKSFTQVGAEDNGKFWDSESDNVLFVDPSLKGTLHTVRAPDENGNTDDEYINSYMSTNIPHGIGSSIYKILTTDQKWNDVSNDVYDNTRHRNTSYVNHTIEGFHDNIHAQLAQGKLKSGSGHIGTPEYAAFDPIFWFHHCNVDRLTAIWQAVQSSNNRDGWWTEAVAGESNWAVPQGTKQLPTDPLAPFRYSKKTSSQEDCWTSNGVQDWTGLGYTYQGKYVKSADSGQNELASFPIQPGKADPKLLNSFINQFYGWTETPTEILANSVPNLLLQFYPIDLSQVEALSGTLGVKRPGHAPLVPSHPERIPDGVPPNPDNPDYTFMSDLISKNRELRQWDIHIVAEKFAIRGSYQIFVFLGPFNPHNPDGWPVEPNLVGIDGIFSTDSRSGGCTNCKEQADSTLRVHDIIPLTQHLIKWIRLDRKCPPEDDGGILLRGLESDQVAPFLAKNLHWRVTDMHLNLLKRDVDFVEVSAVDRVVGLPARYDEAVSFEAREVLDVDRYGPTTAPKAEGHAYSPADRPGYGGGAGGEAQGAGEEQDQGGRGGRSFCGMRCIVQ